MCSSFDEGEIRPLKAEKCDLQLTQCMKCRKNTPQVVIRVNDAFCKECFIQYSTHKFRSAFGKSKIIRDGERVLVAFSGGHASTAMLHLVKEGKSVRAQKKLRFVPGLIFVDDGAVLEISDGDRQTTIDRFKETFDKTGYPYHMVKLEQVFEGDGEEGTAADRLRSLFHSLQTLTAKEQLIKTLRQQLISQIAKSEGYSKVIVGDTSTRLSAAILSNVAQGKAAHISYDTSLVDDRDPELLIVRPMKDFTNKEAAMYNRFFGLTPHVIPTFTTKGTSSASIDRLTETFVTGLQADFPSTVNTIMRTGDKLKNSKSQQDAGGDTDSQANCMICKAPLDTTSKKSSALGSIICTEELAKLRISDSTGGSSNVTAGDRAVNLEYTLSSCYSCQQMLRDMPQPQLLPEVITARNANRLMMKNYIESNLLP